MKRWFFTLALMAVSVVANSQITQSFDAPEPDLRSNINSEKRFKAGGDTIWSTTFDWADPSAPLGWKLPSGWTVEDYTDLGNPWIWRKDTLRWSTSKLSPPSFFKSVNDGFIVMPIIEYNFRDGVFVSHKSDTYIMTPPIDCSNSPSVVVSLSQWWRHCCGAVAMQMQVTSDGGAHWAIYDMTYGTGSNTYTPPRYRNVEINISEVAAGAPAVQIKFYMAGAENYFWEIDDLVLTEAYTSDLVLDDAWTFMNGGRQDPVGLINYLPISQINSPSEVEGIIGELGFRGSLLNNGMNDAEEASVNVSILKNGQEVWNKTTESSNLWSLDRDTVEISQRFLPDDYGDYTIRFYATQAGDERPLNNYMNMAVTVNDTLYQRADFTTESSANSGGYVGGGNAGDMVGMIYDLPVASEINSITAYISGFEPNSNTTFQMVLLKFMEADNVYTEWLVSDIVDMNESMAKTFVTMPLTKDGETEFLEPGTYIAAVRSWGEAPNDPDGIPGMWIGWDLTTRGENAFTWVYLSTLGTEFATNRLLQIGLNFEESGGPDQAPVTFNVDMNKQIASGEFIPGTDNVDVAGSFNNWAGSDYLSDTDNDGIYTITLDNMPVGQKIEFKYRINKSWDTSEFPSGGPNRTYTIRYWNVLNHIYNNGITMGRAELTSLSSLSVFPNPSDGIFTLDISLENPVEGLVIVTDVQGKELLRRALSGSNHQTVRFEESLAPGIYFVNFRNKKENLIEKLIIR